TAYYSHSALSQAAAGRELPSLAVTLAFAEACGGDRREWTGRWQQAAAEAGVLTGPDDCVTDTEVAVSGTVPATRPAAPGRGGIRARLARVRRGGWYRLAAAGLVCGLAGWGMSSLGGTTTSPVHAFGGLSAPVADGVPPSVADCSSWIRTLGRRSVLTSDGQLLGNLDLQYSMRCGAVWARFSPRPALSGAGTVSVTLEVRRQPDGKTMTYRGRNSGHVQRSNVLLLHGGCAQASVTLGGPGQALASVATGCQPPP
ncbi:MAG TPA: hypothetical protein VKU39_12195, partial [Streptosporangiaceae bacterium]|nr:hypothetical protein [Streptosporangiaceae bacterium]